jgi:hypothetical protein
MSILDEDSQGVKPVGTDATLPGRNDPPDVLPIPETSPGPVTLFCRLRRALAEGDHRLEQLARAELRKIGWLVKVTRSWRKGRSR